MDADRFRQVKAVVVEALELPREERSAFVANACGDDAELRAEVESLLGEDEAPLPILSEGLVDREAIGALVDAIDEVTPEPGMKVGRFELIREIGRGGMGQVFLAKDTRLSRDVALKFMHVRSPELIARFLSEARATAQCRHENIVLIYEADEALGMPYLALEYLDGESLAEVLARGPVSAERAVEIMLPVVRALVCAHDRGIVHRDLKPDNIFLLRSGEVKVLDFGIAKLFDQESRELARPSDTTRWAADRVITEQSALVGTVPYMSPEQWGLGAVDHRSDLWAVGIILWQLLTGDHPVAAATPPQLRESAERLDEPLPPVKQAAPDVPSDLAAVIDACLVKQKEHRIGTARELLEALERTQRRTNPPEPWLIRFSPAWTWGVFFVCGWALLGASLGLGVGTSYTSSINWGPNFIVVIPFLAAACLRSIHRGDDALRSLGGAHMLVDAFGRYTLENPGFDQWRRRLTATNLLVAIAVPACVAVSVAEWSSRVSERPMPGEWWTDSPVLGVSGAVMQGLIIGTMIVAAVVMTAYTWTLLDLASGRLSVRTTLESNAEDGRGGFGRFEDCLESILAAVGLLYVALWASSVQHIALERTLAQGRPVDLSTVLFSGSLFEIGPSHYSIQMTVIACATTLTIGGLLVYWTHRAYWLTARGRRAGASPPSPWLLPHVPLPALVAVLVAAQASFVFFRVGLGVLAVLAVVLVVRMGRALSPEPAHRAR